MPGGRGGGGMRRGGGARGGGRGGAARGRGRHQMRRRRRRRMMLVGGLVAFGAYKMSKRDADRIQQDTGTAPEDMTDEELEASMAKLGIEKQYRDATDVEEAAPSGISSVADELQKLAKLRDQGILTDEEFDAMKKKLLDS